MIAMTEPTAQEQPLLEVRDLAVSFTTATGKVEAVRGANLTVYPGQTVAIVGESGSGKSTTAHAIINLLPGTGHVTGGKILFNGKDLAKLSKKEIVEVRGREIGLVPQDPMSNLNPVWSIGYQVKETLKANGVDVSKARRNALVDGLTAAENGDTDRIYVGQRQKKALITAIEQELASDRRTSEEIDSITKALTKQLIVGSTTRADAVLLLGKLNVPKAVALSEEHLVTGSDRSNTRDRVAGLLSESGLPDAERRIRQYPHEFSGGMRQRALIAIGLAARPKLLIADEPTSALDVTVQRQILDHLELLTNELGTAVLFITHDLGLAAERAEHLVVMYKGQIVESGPALQILQSPQHPYTKRLVGAAPSLASRRIQSAKEAGLESAELLAPAGGDVSDAKGDTFVRVENLTKEFAIRGGKGDERQFKAVDDVSFNIKRGTTVALVGESGSGKSTVANIMLNLLKPTQGSIWFDGVDTSTLNNKQLFDFRRRVQPIFQNPYGSLDPMYSIYRIIEEPLRVHGVGDSKSRNARVRDLLDKVALPQSVMRRFPNELSGGQRQRVAIARALALEPEVVICDEAVSALDVLVQAQILELLNKLQEDLGLSYLFITHDLAVVRQIADQVCVMENGKLVEQGAADQIFEAAQHPYTRELLAAIPGGSIELGSAAR